MWPHTCPSAPRSVGLLSTLLRCVCSLQPRRACSTARVRRIEARRWCVNVTARCQRGGARDARRQGRRGCCRYAARRPAASAEASCSAADGGSLGGGGSPTSQGGPPSLQLRPQAGAVQPVLRKPLEGEG